MSLSAKIREQIISSFKAELVEHIQTMTNGLLAIEQRQIPDDQRQPTLENIFRAAHSLKGAARAVGVTAIEQLAHALEDVLGALQRDAIEPGPELFNACYKALDAIQMVQAVYESGGTTPPAQTLEALASLDPFRGQAKSARQRETERSKTRAEAVEQAAPAVDAQPPTPSSQQPPASDETIRVSVSKLDALMAHLSELLVTKIRAEQHMAQMQQAQEFVAAWQKDWLSIRGGYGRLARQIREATTIVSVDMETASVQKQLAPAEKQEQANRVTIGDGKLDKEALRLVNYVDENQERLRQMNAMMNTLSREYTNATLHMALVIDELEQEIKRARMLPLNTITGPFARMARDLAHAAGKLITLEITGGEVELDKRVLEQIKDPLIHLLRNAIDHGIELPERRAELGKPLSGVVTLSAKQLGKDVVVRVSDDGAGLNIEAIRKAALRRGVLDALSWSEAELADLIFNSGFSTSPIVTDVSGRGVGLDVVRRNVESLRGRLSMDWSASRGATFTLTLPLALTSSRGLLVRASDQLFAIPLGSIERIEQITPEQITPMGGHDTLRYQGRPLMLARLNDVLGLPRRDHMGDDASTLVIVLAAAERRMAFAVDGLAGEQEIVIKGLGKQLSRVGGVAGATILGNGEVILILNASDLIKLALRSEHRPTFDAPAAPPARKRILIVDDSITTRTLEKNILEAAGYTVQLAIDGQEALGLIAASAPDLIVSDIAMPRLDGFALTQQLKSDTRTSALPVILVTSLDSPHDKARGIEAGADAYIVKRGFDQHNLLETIEQLI